MPINLNKEYLTRKDCEKLLRTAVLSRSESVAIPRHLANMFESAERQGHNHGRFTYTTGKTEIAVVYERQSGGAQSVLLHRDCLYALVPALATTEAAPPPRQSAPYELKQATPQLKRADALGPEWATFNELVELLRAQALKNGKDVHLRGALTKAFPKLLEAFPGETGTVKNIRCHKHRGSDGYGSGHSLSVHREDIQALYEYVGMISTSIYLNGKDGSKEAGLRR